MGLACEGSVVKATRVVLGWYEQGLRAHGHRGVCAREGFGVPSAPARQHAFQMSVRWIQGQGVLSVVEQSVQRRPDAAEPR